MPLPLSRRPFPILFGLAALLLSSCAQKTQPSSQSPQSSAAAGAKTLLNVSYDPTREFYQDYNAAFAKYWKGKTGQDVTIRQSHGGSGKQARSVIDGSEADVVTLGVQSDIDAIQKAGLINAGWQSKLPNDSAPYTSTVVFLVRKGNPKGIKDWPDLVKPGIGVITPNPKTSSGGRWAYLAAYGYALKTNGNNDAAARTYITQLYKNVPKLDSGARGSTETFTKNGVGDVLLAWENEAQLAVQQGAGQYEIVRPSQSILAEPPVAVVDKNVDKHGTRDVATEYLKHLYTEEGQTIAAKHFYRPRLASVAKQYASQFPNIPLFDIGLFGGWPTAQKTHFADGGVFDQIYGNQSRR
ncbi:MAG: sulfate ABC transporter substrate-binding protein [Armatimonadetes bacterium]|nr:sulfate ABC transporter substrate-binding protein [Armatimonadota bacterium]